MTSRSTSRRVVGPLPLLLLAVAFLGFATPATADSRSDFRLPSSFLGKLTFDKVEFGNSEARDKAPAHPSSGSLTLDEATLSLRGDGGELKIDPEKISGVTFPGYGHDSGNEWVFVEYRTPEAGETVAIKTAGAGGATGSLYKAILATWLAGAPPPAAAPPPADAAALLEEVGRAPLDSKEAQGREVPASVWALIFAPGLERPLVDAYMAEPKNDRYRFTLIRILARRLTPDVGKEDRELVRDCLIHALRDDPFEWVKVEALEALFTLGRDHEVGREVQALLESQGAAGAVVRYGLAKLAGKSSRASPLFVAAKNGWNDAVARLLKEGADKEWRAPAPAEGWTPLMIASAENHGESVKHLLEAGADPNARNAMGRTPVMFAAHYGFTDIVEMLAKAGADLDTPSEDEQRRPAIIAASENGHAGTVAALIRLGADPDVAEANGFTALMHAAGLGGSLEVVKVLLDGGADVNVAPFGTPLSSAATAGRPDVVRLLLDRGASINATYSFLGIDGITALMQAAREGHVEVVKLLLDRGADVNMRVTGGASALAMARMNDRDEVAALIEEAGGQE